MKKLIVLLSAATVSLSAYAPDAGPQFKIYGFVRNFFSLDSRDGVSGTDDFFYYMPKDLDINPADGTDANAVSSFRFAALTTRVGLDIVGYQVRDWEINARIEGDFCAGLTGATGAALFRFRQAYVTLARNAFSIKIGQGWHPMAADLPDVFSVSAGAPFGPFSRTPEVVADIKPGNAVTLTAAALWQMQYTSSGPDGASADYIKYGCIPEFYAGLSFTTGGFLARVGADVLSISPSMYSYMGEIRKNRITTVSPLLYMQYKSGDFSVKFKSVFAQAGEHMNLNGGYGVSAFGTDGSTGYAPTRNSSSWLSFSYVLNNWQFVMFGGYVKNFGCKDKIIDKDHLYFSKNSFSNMNCMWRLTPTVVYNLGKVALGLEYELTGVRYGSFDSTGEFHGLATKDLHDVSNNRFNAFVKYTF